MLGWHLVKFASFPPLNPFTTSGSIQESSTPASWEPRFHLAHIRNLLLCKAKHCCGCYCKGGQNVKWLVCATTESGDGGRGAVVRIAPTQAPTSVPGIMRSTLQKVSPLCTEQSRVASRGALVARDLATGGGEWVRSCGVGTKTVKCQSSCKLLWMQALSTTRSSGQLEQLCGNFLGADSQVPRHSTFSSTKTSRIIFTTFSTKHGMPSTSRT